MLLFGGAMKSCSLIINLPFRFVDYFAIGKNNIMYPTTKPSNIYWSFGFLTLKDKYLVVLSISICLKSPIFGWGYTLTFHTLPPQTSYLTFCFRTFINKGNYRFTFTFPVLVNIGIFTICGACCTVLLFNSF